MKEIKVLAFDTGGTVLDWHAGLTAATATAGADTVPCHLRFAGRRRQLVFLGTLPYWHLSRTKADGARLDMLTRFEQKHESGSGSTEPGVASLMRLDIRSAR